MGWTREEAQRLANLVLSFSTTPECEVALKLYSTSYSRFAGNELTTSGEARDLSIVVTSRGGGKSGTVRLTETDPAALRRAVAQSGELMALAPVDPEYVEGLPPQRYPEINAFDEETALAGAAERLQRVKAALEAAREKKLVASGFFELLTEWRAIANKKGNFAFHPSTSCSFSNTARTPDGTGSGWAGHASPRISEIRAAEIAARSTQKAIASAKPRELPPGSYTVVLEPEAVLDLLSHMQSVFSLRAAEEGRSFFAKAGGGTRIGERLFADTVTLRTDPFEARIPGTPWASGFGNLPARATTWIEKGVLRALPLDRYFAKKTDREPVPLSGAMVLTGGSGSLEDLIAGTERGLLVTRFWYIRTTNPYNADCTGLTRDGVWLVEKGAVVAPVNNFRFNMSPLQVLKNIEAMSASVSTGEMVVPAIRARDFAMTSKSDAV
jgi:predicted Zn-dependent protease